VEGRDVNDPQQPLPVTAITHTLLSHNTGLTVVTSAAVYTAAPPQVASPVPGPSHHTPRPAQHTRGCSHWSCSHLGWHTPGYTPQHSAHRPPHSHPDSQQQDSRPHSRPAQGTRSQGQARGAQVGGPALDHHNRPHTPQQDTAPRSRPRTPQQDTAPRSRPRTPQQDTAPHSHRDAQQQDTRPRSRPAQGTRSQGQAQGGQARSQVGGPAMDHQMLAAQAAWEVVRRLAAAAAALQATCQGQGPSAAAAAAAEGLLLLLLLLLLTLTLNQPALALPPAAADLCPAQGRAWPLA